MEEEIRKKAILRYIVDKEKPPTIYTNLGRTKPWFFKWLKRYLTGNADWYRDQSRVPLKKPTEISKGNRDLIVTTRRRLESGPCAQIGVSAIKWELRKLGASFPSDNTLHRILKREGRVKKTAFVPNIVLIRFIRSDRMLDIFGEKFMASKDLFYSYVKAVVITDIHTLAVYLGNELVQAFEYVFLPRHGHDYNRANDVLTLFTLKVGYTML